MLADAGPPLGRPAGPATGRGVRVCVVDSGVERDHPLVGPLAGSWVVVKDGESGGSPSSRPRPATPASHGTACAGIVRRTAPECEIHSVRVLGERFSGTGDILMAGLRWAVEQRFDVVNLSLSTTRTRFAQELHSLADSAYFARTVIVASAHTPRWRASLAVRLRDLGGQPPEDDPELHLYSGPPVEFFGPRPERDRALAGRPDDPHHGEQLRHAVRRRALRPRAVAHPRMTAFQLKAPSICPRPTCATRRVLLPLRQEGTGDTRDDSEN